MTPFSQTDIDPCDRRRSAARGRKIGAAAGLGRRAALCVGFGLISLFVLPACTEPFSGARIEMTLRNAPFPEEVTQGGLSGQATHYELWATIHDVIVPIHSFNVVPAVRPSDPCAIDLSGEQAGMGISDAAAARRAAAISSSDVPKRLAAEQQIARIDRVASILRAVVSHTVGSPKPAQSIGALAPAERLSACTEFFRQNPDYYVGNYRVLTDPSAGQLFGLVDGNDPDSGGFVGGISLQAPFRLDDVVELFVTLESDDNPDTRGAVFLSGRTERVNRGVIQARLTSSMIPSAGGSIALFSDLDTDPVNF